MSGIKMTKKLLSTYRKAKSEIPLLEHEIAYMQQEDNGFDNSIILDYRTGEPRAQAVVGFDWERYGRRQQDLEKKHGIKRGDIIQIITTSYSSGEGKIIRKKIKAKGKALYPYVVELQLQNGITRSPTYWELERLKAGGGTDGQGHSGTIPGDKRGNP